MWFVLQYMYAMKFQERRTKSSDGDIKGIDLAFRQLFPLCIFMAINRIKIF